MSKNLNLRTILIITISLSSIAVIRQNITTQLIVMGTALILLLIHEERKNLFGRIFGRFRHLWIAVVSIFILQVLFRREGEAILSYGLLKVTEGGIAFGVIVSLRLLNLILISGLLFSISTSDYLLAFRAWKVPYEISFLITTVIRFIPDYYKMFLAYRENLYLRNINIKKLSLKAKFTALLSLLIPVLSNALTEVKSRAIALDLKCFRLHKERTYLHESRLKTIDYLLQAVCLIAFIVLIVV